MQYRVEELAQAAGVGVGTIRFYQARGLLPAPERRGRVAIYRDEHLERLRQIRSLNRQGLTLEATGRVLEAAEARAADPSLRESLLDALAEAEGERSYDSAELAAASGFPEFLFAAIEELGLLQPTARTEGGAPRYSEVDRRSLAAARSIATAGIPLPELLALAREHVEHVERLTDRAVALFEDHVRRSGGGSEPDARITATLRELLPAATALVVLHFQRTLIQRARARLASASGKELADVLAASEGNWP